MRATLSEDRRFVFCYNKNEDIVWAWTKRASERELSQRLLEILDMEWEYKTPYHDDKQQLEIDFNANQ